MTSIMLNVWICRVREWNGAGCICQPKNKYNKEVQIDDTDRAELIVTSA